VTGIGSNDSGRFRPGFSLLACGKLFDGGDANNREKLGYEILRDSIECFPKAFHQRRD